MEVEEDEDGCAAIVSGNGDSSSSSGSSSSSSGSSSSGSGSNGSDDDDNDAEDGTSDIPIIIIPTRTPLLLNENLLPSHEMTSASTSLIDNINIEIEPPDTEIVETEIMENEIENEFSSEERNNFVIDLKNEFQSEL